MKGRPTSRAVQLIVAIWLELVAFALLLLNPAASSMLVSFVILHLLSSIVVAQIVWASMPAHYQEPRRRTLAFLAAFAFFTPGLACIGMLMLALAANLMKTRYVKHPISGLNLPEYFGGAAAAPPPNYGPGGIRARLFSKGVAPEARVKALLSVQAMPPQIASSLWRSLLSDSMDDIRLIAYGTLDAREKGLMRSILDLEKTLEATTEPAARAPLLRQLAELHWEMLYLGIAQGAVAEFIRGKIRHYAQECIELDPQDSTLWQLLARLALSVGDPDEAVSCFNEALTLGMPPARVTPYLAEIAFRAGDHAQARAILRSVPASQYALGLAPVIEMWCREQVA
jgi:polysaccharide biosynthesis protein PelE